MMELQPTENFTPVAPQQEVLDDVKLVKFKEALKTALRAERAEELQSQQYLLPNYFQSGAMEAINEAMKTMDSGICVMPTGAGKTVFASLWYQQQLRLNPRARLLFVCHNKDIVAQANEKEFKASLKKLGVGYSYYNGQEKHIAQAVFATTQTLTRNLDKFTSDSFDFIVVDEAHHYQAKTFKKVVEFFNKRKFLLGLTATPYRADGQNITDICGKIFYEAKIAEGIRKGILSKINYWCVDNDIDFSEVKWNGVKYDEKDLNRKVCVSKYDEAIIGEYKKNVEKHGRKKTIAFCATVEHCWRMARKFNANGIKAVALTGKNESRNSIGRGTRSQVVKDFRDGKYEVIFVRDLFNEGIDVPDADCIMMLRPTQSHGIFTQQIGRGLRTFTGKDYCLVLDFTGNARRCQINFKYLTDAMELDIIERLKSNLEKDPQKTSEITYINNGCEVRLSKAKINLFRRKDICGFKREKILNDYNNGKPIYKLSNELNINQRAIRNFLRNENIEIRSHIKTGKKNREFMVKNKDRILNDYINGKSLSNICENSHFLISYRNVVANFLRKEKIKIRNIGGLNRIDVFSNSILTNNQEKIIQDYTNGKSLGCLSKELGFHYSIIKRFLKNHGIKTRNYKQQAKLSAIFSPSNLSIISAYVPKTKLEVEKVARGHGGTLKQWKRGYKENNDEKTELRTKIISKIQDGDCVLMLESPELLALKEIEKQGKKPSKIVIPNHIEFKQLANALRHYKTDLKIELINTSALQYLSDTEEKFDFLWLDYCGAFTHNTRDLDALFRKDFTNMKLNLTYNTFDMDKADADIVDKKDYFVKVIDYVLEKAKGKNVRILNDVSYRYKKNMYNVGFNIGEAV